MSRVVSSSLPSSPQISVVMPAHNSAKYISEAMDSVLQNQSVELELIVINDGSQDDSAAIVQSKADSRVVLLQNAAAGGPSRARNQGIRAARAPYIAFLDSDDVKRPEALRSAVVALDSQPCAVMAIGDLERIDLQGTVTKPSVLAEYPVFQQLARTALPDEWQLIRQQDFAAGLLYENFIGTGSVVVRKRALAITGLFDETLFNSEDRDLWFRLARQGDVLYSQRVVYAYRVNTASISFGPAERNCSNRITVLRRERQHWTQPAARRQLDRLIAEDLASIGYARRHQGRRLAAAASFTRALYTSPNWRFFKGLIGAFVAPNR